MGFQDTPPFQGRGRSTGNPAQKEEGGATGAGTPYPPAVVAAVRSSALQLTYCVGRIGGGVHGVENIV